MPNKPGVHSPSSILLAVAVHDEGEARLEPAAPARIKVAAGTPLRFRISYRLADNAGAREDAVLEALLHVRDEAPLSARVAMRDRPLLNDARLGDLEFNVRPLPPGVHTLRYSVRMETSDQDTLLTGQPRLQSTHVDGSIDVEAV